MTSSMNSSQPSNAQLDGLDYNSPAAEIRAEIDRLQAIKEPIDPEAMQERIAELEGYLELATEEGGPVKRVMI